MAKTAGSALITELARRLNFETANATVRADMLLRLNASQHDIVQGRSLRFLVAQGTVTLNSAASTAAVPTTIDDGKALTLGRASSDGEIEYVPLDEWYRTNLDAYGAITQTEPSHYTIAQVSSALTFLFKPGNTSGAGLTIPYLAQLIPTAIADSSTTSILPEGWEVTLLLLDAEAEERRILGYASWAEMKVRADTLREALYESYRTSKEQPMTDREQAERKAAREQLAPEK